jgi:hypothetical protein
MLRWRLPPDEQPAAGRVAGLLAAPAEIAIRTF